MNRKTFKDLKHFYQDKEQFIHCLNLCDDKVRYLKSMFGFDFDNLRHGFVSEEGMINEVIKNTKGGFDDNKSFLYAAIDLLLSSFDNALVKEKQMQENPLEWSTLYFIDLEKRIKLDSLQQNGYLDMYKQGIIPKENLINYMHSNEPLSKDQYFWARIIRKNEFDKVIKRFGRAVILNSLHKNSNEYKELMHNKMLLEVSLNDIELPLRLHPKEVRNNHGDTYELALEMYKRYEWALMDVCKHSFSVNNLVDVKKMLTKCLLTMEKMIQELS